MNPRRGVPPLGLVLLVASPVLGLVALVPFSMGVTHLRRDYRLALAWLSSRAIPRWRTRSSLSV